MQSQEIINQIDFSCAWSGFTCFGNNPLDGTPWGLLWAVKRGAPDLIWLLLLQVFWPPGAIGGGRGNASNRKQYENCMPIAWAELSHCESGTKLLNIINEDDQRECYFASEPFPEQSREVVPSEQASKLTGVRQLQPQKENRWNLRMAIAALNLSLEVAAHRKEARNEKEIWLSEQISISN